MKLFFRFFNVTLLSAVLAVTGCDVDDDNHEAGEQQEHHASDEHGVEFQEGKGLHVPEHAIEMLGVKVVDVTEGKVSGQLELALRVFQHGGEGGKLYASGAISTNDAALLKRGQPVLIQPLHGSLEGEVARVDKSSANATSLAEVIVELPEAAGLTVGAFVDGTVETGGTEEVILIPQKALLKTAEGHFVYVVNGDHYFRTPVAIGVAGEEMVEVREGLYAGDQVVVQPVKPLWLAELQSIRGGQSCIHGH